MIIGELVLLLGDVSVWCHVGFSLAIDPVTDCSRKPPDLEHVI